MTLGRKDIISLDEQFMSIALIASKRSKDPSTQVGACIVNANDKLVSTGHNAPIKSIDECVADNFDWTREGGLGDSKYAYILHAEVSAILHAMTNFKHSLNGCTLYVTLFPCHECAKLIVQCGIRRVIYLHDKYSDTESVIVSKKILASANIITSQFKPKNKVMSISFE